MGGFNVGYSDLTNAVSGHLQTKEFNLFRAVHPQEWTQYYISGFSPLPTEGGWANGTRYFKPGDQPSKDWFVGMFIFSGEESQTDLKGKGRLLFKAKIGAEWATAYFQLTGAGYFKLPAYPFFFSENPLKDFRNDTGGFSLQLSSHYFSKPILFGATINPILFGAITHCETVLDGKRDEAKTRWIGNGGLGMQFMWDRACLITIKSIWDGASEKKQVPYVDLSVSWIHKSHLKASMSSVIGRMVTMPEIYDAGSYYEDLCSYASKGNKVSANHSSTVVNTVEEKSRIDQTDNNLINSIPPLPDSQFGDGNYDEPEDKRVLSDQEQLQACQELYDLNTRLLNQNPAIGWNGLSTLIDLEKSLGVTRENIANITDIEAFKRECMRNPQQKFQEEIKQDRLKSQEEIKQDRLKKSEQRVEKLKNLRNDLSLFDNTNILPVTEDNEEAINADVPTFANLAEELKAAEESESELLLVPKKPRVRRKSSLPVPTFKGHKATKSEGTNSTTTNVAERVNALNSKQDKPLGLTRKFSAPTVTSPRSFG